MKVICILCDSLNRHFLNAYGHPVAQTPNLDWLASRSHVFERHFSGSVPTMPTRREVWTGKHEFLWRPWGALEPWDRDLPGILRENNILTMLITDSYHLFENGSGNYHVKFEGWEFYRGFENDPWVTEPPPPIDYAGNMRDRYLRNMRRMQRESDLPPAKTLRAVERWLQKNACHENFFLMVDEFAPHEPFNAPEYMIRKYDPDYSGPLYCWPKYGRNVHTDEEVQQLRCAYAAHVSLVDKYLGRIFQTMTDLDLWDDTALILMTDHGHYLGEHGFTGKPGCACYNTLVHIPFIMYVPGQAAQGGRIDALSANVDVFSTVLDLFDLDPPKGVHARSLLPLITGDAPSVRDWTLYGYFGRFANITDGHTTYLRAPRENSAPLYIYSLGWNFGRYTGRIPPIGDNLELGRFMPDVEMPVCRLPMPPEDFAPASIADGFDHLYDIDSDPDQTKNLAGGSRDTHFAGLLKEALSQVACPQEQFARLDLD